VHIASGAAGSSCHGSFATAVIEIEDMNTGEFLEANGELFGIDQRSG
jgi:hypothetical protein